MPTEAQCAFNSCIIWPVFSAFLFISTACPMARPLRPPRLQPRKRSSPQGHSRRPIGAEFNDQHTVVAVYELLERVAELSGCLRGINEPCRFESPRAYAPK